MKYDFLIVNFYPIMGMIFGLAITKEILSHMNGSITVQSEYGTGTSFTVIIPQKASDMEPVGRIDYMVIADQGRDDVPIFLREHILAIFRCDAVRHNAYLQVN